MQVPFDEGREGGKPHVGEGFYGQCKINTEDGREGEFGGNELY